MKRLFINLAAPFLSIGLRLEVERFSSSVKGSILSANVACAGLHQA